MPTIVYRYSLLLIAVLGVALSAAPFWSEAQPIQDKQVPPPATDPVNGDDTFWLNNQGLQIQAAAHCFADGAARSYVGGSPAVALGPRVLASEYQFFKETDNPWRFTFHEVLPLKEANLEKIKDGRTLPSVYLKDPLIDLPIPDRGWYLAFLNALERSDQATMEMFQNSAKKSEDVLYPNLASKPDRYRGKIITIKGKITLIRRHDAPRGLNVPGLSKIYTTWIIGPTQGAHPFTAAFTELPRELDVSEKLNAEVTFYGYFLSIVKIPADKERGISKKDILSPYLVGKTLIVHQVPPPPIQEEASYSYPLIAAVIGGIVAIVFLGGLLNVWLRRGDRHTHSRLQEVRDRQNPFHLEPADEAVTEPIVGEVLPAAEEPIKIKGKSAAPIANDDNGVKAKDAPS